MLATQGSSGVGTSTDAFIAEIVRNTLVSIADEMKDVLDLAATQALRSTLP